MILRRADQERDTVGKQSRGPAFLGEARVCWARIISEVGHFHVASARHENSN